jgi:CBS-domain-containing membrane protein
MAIYCVAIGRDGDAQALVGRGVDSGERAGAQLRQISWPRVNVARSDRVISANEDTPLSEIANLLKKHRIKRVPILRDGKLVGIVSRSNLIQALASVDRPARRWPRA